MLIDRTEAAVAKNGYVKPPRRRVRYSAVAAAALLLIGISGFAYYKHISRPPLVTVSKPVAPLNPSPLAPTPFIPSPKQNDIPKDTPATMPQLPAENLNRSEVVRRFVQQYDGGDCFFVSPMAVSATAAAMEGFSASTAPFELLDKAFKKSQGFEASIGVRLVAQPQCPAITFLNRIRMDGGRPPRISLGSVKLRPGETLVGSIDNFVNRVVELLLIFSNGQVQNMSYLLKPGTDSLSFAIDIPRSDDTTGATLPNLLMAVATPRVLDSLRQPRLTPADQFFLQAFSEAQRANLTISASARYFTIQK
jgi:hypothetical protein